MQKLIVFSPGTLVHVLDRKKMGCLKKLSISVGVTIGILVLFLVVAIVVVNRKWEAIRFFLFMRCDILIKDDDPEKVDDLEFDAFVTYRQEFVSLIEHIDATQGQMVYACFLFRPFQPYGSQIYEGSNIRLFGERTWLHPLHSRKRFSSWGDHSCQH